MAVDIIFLIQSHLNTYSKEYTLIYLKVRLIQIQPVLLKINKCALLKAWEEKQVQILQIQAEWSCFHALFCFLPLCICKESIQMGLASYQGSLRLAVPST